jgi:hypothetical protein
MSSNPEVWIERVGAGLRPLVEIASSVAASSDKLTADVDRAWRELCAVNDSLYDGPILRVRSADAQTGSIVCERSTFRHLATAGRLGRDVRQLGVVGWLIGCDRTTGEEHVLLGRRGASTRVYPGLWENAPSGGVPGVPLNLASLEAGALYAALSDEAEEELGIALPAFDSGPVAFDSWIHDPVARSLDLVVCVDVGMIDAGRLPCLASGGEPDDQREYIDSSWLSRGEAAAYFDRHANAISPPTLALARHMGWAGR